MAKAIWNDTVVAESDDTVVVDGNHYFPPDSIKQDLFKPSSKTSVCGWKDPDRTIRPMPPRSKRMSSGCRP